MEWLNNREKQKYTKQQYHEMVQKISSPLDPFEQSQVYHDIRYAPEEFLLPLKEIVLNDSLKAPVRDQAACAIGAMAHVTEKQKFQFAEQLAQANSYMKCEFAVGMLKEGIRVSSIPPEMINEFSEKYSDSLLEEQKINFEMAYSLPYMLIPEGERQQVNDLIWATEDATEKDIQQICKIILKKKQHTSEDILVDLEGILNPPGNVQRGAETNQLMEEVAPILVKIIADEKNDAQYTAASALRCFGQQAKGVLDQLEELMSRQSRYAFIVLSGLDELALPIAQKDINHSQSAVRNVSVNLLGEMPPEKIPGGTDELEAIIRPLLDDSDSEVPFTAANALVKIGRGDHRCYKMYLDYAMDISSNDEEMAQDLLKDYFFEAPLSVQPLLIHIITDTSKSGDLRYYAARGLHNMPVKDQESLVKMIKPWLVGENEEESRIADRLLYDVDEGLTDLVPFFVNKLKEGTPKWIRRSLEVLSRIDIGDQSVFEAAFPYLEDKQYRHDALRLILRNYRNPMPDKLYNYLHTTMLGPDKELSQEVTVEFSFWTYKTPAIQKLVWEGLSQGDIDVKYQCASAIADTFIHGDEAKRAEIKEFFAEYPGLIPKLDPSEAQYIHLHILDALKDN